MKPINKFSGKPLTKGQALTELAIFGSILLFCVAMLLQYGLEANYQQQAQMEVFRKAQKLAFYRSGPGANTSLVLVKDKAIPDPRDQWGFAERYPVVVGGSVTWDTNLSTQYVTNYAQAPEATDLPAVYFEVDKISAAELSRVRTNASAEVPAAAAQNKVFGFYTARFQKAPCLGSIKVVFEDPQHRRGREYVEEVVGCGEIRVMRMDGDRADPNSHLLMYPYFRDSNMLKRRIIWADVDGDDKLEQIIAAIIAANGNKEFFYIDYHDGGNARFSPLGGAIQIDTDYLNAAAYPYGNAYSPEVKQGLIPDFRKSIEHTGSNIVKEEVGGNITSRTELRARQIITHKIRLNSGAVVEIPVEFTPDRSQSYNWR